MPKPIVCLTCGPDPSRRKQGNQFAAFNESEGDDDDSGGGVCDAPTAIALTSEEGARLLSECGDRAAYDRIWPHFKKQSGTAMCGPATLAMLMNALRGDNVWSEDDVLLRGPPALRDKVRLSGCTLHEAAALARTAGVEASIHRGDAAWLVDALTTGRALVAANYHMTTAGQPPFSGHHSPVAAYHAASRRFLVLDCWPHTGPAWLEADALIAATELHDPESSQPRGFLILCENSKKP